MPTRSRTRSFEALGIRQLVEHGRPHRRLVPRCGERLVHVPHLPEAPVHDQHASLPVVDEDAVRGGLDHVAEELLALAKGGLRALALRDVGLDPDDAQGLAVAVPLDHVPPVEDPDVGPVLAPQPVLRREIRDLAAVVPARFRFRAREVVGVHARGPVLVGAADLVFLVPEHRLPAPRVEHATARDVPVPHAVTGALERELPARLALPQRFLGGEAIQHVPEVHAHRLQRQHRGVGDAVDAARCELEAPAQLPASFDGQGDDRPEPRALREGQQVRREVAHLDDRCVVPTHQGGDPLERHRPRARQELVGEPEVTAELERAVREGLVDADAVDARDVERVLRDGGVGGSGAPRLCQRDAEVALHLQQPLRPLAVTDVAREAHGADDGPVLGFHGRLEGLEPAVAPREVDLLLDGPRRPRLHDRPIVRLVALGELPRRDVEVGAADEPLGIGLADTLGKLTVDRDEAALLVLHPGDERQGLDQRAPQRRALACGIAAQDGARLVTDVVHEWGGRGGPAWGGRGVLARASDRHRIRR